MNRSLVLFDSDSLKDFHKRIFFSMIVFLFIYFVAIYRIVAIMLFTSHSVNVTNDDKFKERGNIYDRNGSLLATSIDSNIFTIAETLQKINIPIITLLSINKTYNTSRQVPILNFLKSILLFKNAKFFFSWFEKILNLELIYFLVEPCQSKWSFVMFNINA